MGLEKEYTVTIPRDKLNSKKTFSEPIDPDRVNYTPAVKYLAKILSQKRKSTEQDDNNETRKSS